MTETRWRHAPEATDVDSGDRVVVVDLTARDPRPQVLEGTAATIWRLLAEPRTEDELVTALTDEYDDVDPAQVAADTAGFLQQLAAAGLATTD